MDMNEKSTKHHHNSKYTETKKVQYNIPLTRRPYKRKQVHKFVKIETDSGKDKKDPPEKVYRSRKRSYSAKNVKIIFAKEKEEENLSRSLPKEYESQKHREPLKKPLDIILDDTSEVQSIREYLKEQKRSRKLQQKMSFASTLPTQLKSDELFVKHKRRRHSMIETKQEIVVKEKKNINELPIGKLKHEQIESRKRKPSRSDAKPEEKELKNENEKKKINCSQKDYAKRFNEIKRKRKSSTASNVCFIKLTTDQTNEANVDIPEPEILEQKENIHTTVTLEAATSPTRPKPRIVRRPSVDDLFFDILDEGDNSFLPL